MLGDADRTVCLWARIDEWKGGCLFYYGGDGSQVTSSGGDGASCCTICYGCEFANCNGATTLEEVASQGCCPENFVLRYSIQSYGEDRSKYDCVAFIEEANCDGTWVTDYCARGGEDATGAAMSYSYSYSYGGSSDRGGDLPPRRILLVLVLSRNCDGRGPHGRVCGADIWPLRRKRRGPARDRRREANRGPGPPHRLARIPSLLSHV